MFSRERWLAVPGYEGRYEVSNHGRVRSVARHRFVRAGRKLGRVRERVLKSHKDKRGYIRVALCAEGGQVTSEISKLVASAFLGPRPAGLQTCHNDGDASNNVLENLRYDTPKGNAADRTLHGTETRGEAVRSSKLTEIDVLLIRAFKGMFSMNEFARAFGVRRSHICAIQSKRAWTHV